TLHPPPAAQRAHAAWLHPARPTGLQHPDLTQAHYSGPRPPPRCKQRARRRASDSASGVFSLARWTTVATGGRVKYRVMTSAGELSLVGLRAGGGAGASPSRSRSVESSARLRYFGPSPRYGLLPHHFLAATVRGRN